MNLDNTDQNLLALAKEAAINAYAPYSGYRVGSAILTASGEIFTGANVENASYSLTICAERSAIFKAVNAGYKDFTAIAIYVDSDKDFPPCGACRQVMAEFSPDLKVIYANLNGFQVTDLKTLLPGQFKL